MHPKFLAGTRGPVCRLFFGVGTAGFSRADISVGLASRPYPTKFDGRDARQCASGITPHRGRVLCGVAKAVSCRYPAHRHRTVSDASARRPYLPNFVRGRTVYMSEVFRGRDAGHWASSVFGGRDAWPHASDVFRGMDTWPRVSVIFWSRDGWLQSCRHFGRLGEPTLPHEVRW